MRWHEINEALAGKMSFQYGVVLLWSISSKQELLSLLKRYRHLRLMLEDDGLYAWSGREATHWNYEIATGRKDGIKLNLIQDDKNIVLEYYAHHISSTELEANPLIRRYLTGLTV